MKTHPKITEIEAFQTLIQDADHVDVKQFDGALDLRHFIAGFFSYYPSWMKFLYQVRWVFVRLLGMKQEGVPQDMRMSPEEVSFVVGEKLTFFTVKSATSPSSGQAEPDHYWLAGGTESHLTAHLGVVVEPLENGNNRFHTITIVHYHSWAGPVYFNVIRPFHHIVVRQMGRAAIQSSNSPNKLNFNTH